MCISSTHPFEAAASLLKAFIFAYFSSILLFPIASVFQERRIWQPPSVPSLSFFAHVKVYLFNVFWMGLCLGGGLLILPKMIVGTFFGFNAQRDAHLIERFTGYICTLMFICPSVEIKGRENLPPDDGSAPAPVYIANHASQVDIGVVYFLWREFKWIAKESVQWLPGVGLIMVLGEHVLIRRTGKNKNSVSNLYEQSNKAIQAGLPMFLFPQGTRRMAERLPFKNGAYRIAIENESQLVPISIEIPLSCWNSWYPLCLLWGSSVEKVVLTIHKPLSVKKDMDMEDLKKQTFDTIFSVLPAVEGGKTEMKKVK